MKQFIAALLIVLFAVPTFAADPATTRDKTKKGAAIGAVAGGVLGAVIGNNKGSGNAKRGAIIGAVAGTAVGAGIGAYMDKQERELRQIEGVEVHRTADDELNVVVKNEVLFDFNSAALRGSSRDALSEMADVFKKYNDTTLEVEGHTDSIGSAEYNRSLSRRRANNVADYLNDHGVRQSRLDIVGRGESDPIASNSTSSGRQRNRRVEIHVRANS
jgi:outer membrane protein OmpA-like peptidoglycan-associated protein